MEGETDSVAPLIILTKRSENWKADVQTASSSRFARPLTRRFQLPFWKHSALARENHADVYVAAF